MDKTTRMLIGGGLLFLFLLVLGVGKVVKDNRPPEPTAIPTKAPAQSLTCLGGDIFLNVSRQYLLDTYNVNVEIKKVDTFKMAEYVNEHPGEVDCVWPGSITAYNAFVADSQTKPLDSQVVFRTFATIFTRKDLFLDDLLRYGVVYQRDGGYALRVEVELAAMRAHQTWAQLFQQQAAVLGVEYVSKPWHQMPVNIYYTDPNASSGGLQNLYMIANYLMPGYEHGGAVVDVANIDAMLPYLTENYASQPMQDRRSPDWFNTYVAKSGTYVLAASSESLFLGWYNGLPTDRQGTDGNLIVGIYPEWTVSTDHTLAALTEGGRILVGAFRNDPYLQELGWTKYGMRTATAGIGAKPGDTDVPWIAADPLAVAEPAYDVYVKLKAALADQ